MTDQIMSPSDPEIQDFTEHVDVRFRIDDDVFVGVPNIPGKLLIRFAAEFQALSMEQLLDNPEAFDRLMNTVLTDESATLFSRRMEDKKHPISMQQFMLIVPWIMEKYGMRPTEPSADSSDGLTNPDAGTNSTENRSVTELTSFNFPQPVS